MSELIKEAEAENWRSESKLHLNSSPASKLGESVTSTVMNRSVQMRATNDRLAKLEQMYEELSILEAKAGDKGVIGMR